MLVLRVSHGEHHLGPEPAGIPGQGKVVKDLKQKKHKIKSMGSLLLLCVS